jgi:hypothetical protein
MDDESNGGMVIPPGIHMGEESNGGMDIPPGIHMGEESMKKYDLLILEIVVRNFFIFCL